MQGQDAYNSSWLFIMINVSDPGVHRLNKANNPVFPPVKTALLTCFHSF